MVSGAEHMGAGMAVDEGDSRITRVGAFLRRTSIDELPNLVNVLRGEMSLIGPRPTLQVQVDAYTDRQRRRLDVRPGLTGWAQVNGRASLPVARAHRARPLVPRARVAAARPAHPRPHRPHGGHRSRPLSRRDRWLALAGPPPDPRYGTISGPLSMCSRRKARIASKTWGFMVGQPR